MPRITGWCSTHDCDTEATRGGCPIVAGGTEPCECLCHGGDTLRRPYLPAGVITLDERLSVLASAESDTGEEPDVLPEELPAAA